MSPDHCSPAATPAAVMPPTRTLSVPMYSRVTPTLLPGRRQSALETLGLRRKHEIEIVLDGPDGVVHSYSTYDEIKGTVNLKFDKDTAIDDLTVTFEGVSATFVEKVATAAPTTGRTTGRHVFLKLLQPIEVDSLPENRLAKAGETYKIPFTFVVPDQLLPQICTHAVENAEVSHSHVLLPPSMGDPSLAGLGQSLADDLAPDMAKITYAIRARIAKRNPLGRSVELGDKSVKIRVIPARPDEPPIHIDDDDRDYVLRKEKGVKKGLFKMHKIGRIIAETNQPPSLRLPHVQKPTTQPIATMTTINLRFDPQAMEDQPPPLGSIHSKLRIYTYFGAAPYKRIPAPSSQDHWSTLHGMYPESVDLSSRSLSTVAWTRHEPGEAGSDLVRRPSTFSSSSGMSAGATIPDPSSAYNPSLPFYSAAVLVPLSLPTGSGTKKTFLPTFHSCIISRTYILELSLSYTTPGTSVTKASILLKSPIQISAEGGQAPSQFEESEAAIASEIERQFFNYEARQLQSVSENGPPSQNQANGHDHEHGASPEYSERPHFTSLGEPVVPPPTRHLSIDNSAPPEYHSGAGGRVRGGGPARTQSEWNFFWQRRPSAPALPTAGLDRNGVGGVRQTVSTRRGGRGMSRSFVMLAI